MFCSVFISALKWNCKVGKNNNYDRWVVLSLILSISHTISHLIFIYKTMSNNFNSILERRTWGLNDFSNIWLWVYFFFHCIVEASLPAGLLRWSFKFSADLWDWLFSFFHRQPDSWGPARVNSHRSHLLALSNCFVNTFVLFQVIMIPENSTYLHILVCVFHLSGEIKPCPNLHG